MNSATRLRIDGTPIEWLYAPTLPTSTMSSFARASASAGKILAASGCEMSAGYSVNAAICGVGRATGQRSTQSIALGF